MHAPMGKQVPGVLSAVLVVLVVLTTLGVLALLPIWHCPICDGETWDKIYPGSENVVRADPATCVRCDRTGRMNFFQKWEVIQELRRVRLDKIPLFH